MKQNYNNPVFIYDLPSGADAPDQESINTQFKKAYPTAKEASNFIIYGGKLLLREKDSGVVSYMAMTFQSIRFNPSSLDIVLAFEEDSFTISYITDGSGSGSGGGHG